MLSFYSAILVKILIEPLFVKLKKQHDEIKKYSKVDLHVYIEIQPALQLKILTLQSTDLSTANSKCQLQCLIVITPTAPLCLQSIREFKFCLSTLHSTE